MKLENIILWLCGYKDTIELSKLNDQIKIFAQKEKPKKEQVIKLKKWLCEYPVKYHKDKFSLWITFTDMALRYWYKKGKVSK
jgi:hypothetical protein